MKKKKKVNQYEKGYIDGFVNALKLVVNQFEAIRFERYGDLDKEEK